MARMRRYTTYTERKTAYRSRPKEAELPPLYLPALCPLWQVPSDGRWRMAIDLAARLLESIAEEMQAHCDERCDRWHEDDGGARFVETLDEVNNLHGQLDDLRSRF
jgi:hypothetical protein